MFYICNVKNKIQLFFSSLVLLVSLVSFSGFTYVPNQKPQTELVTEAKIADKTSFSNYNYKAYSHQKVVHNQFTVFNFNCLLNKQLFDVSITVKSQKEKTLQFLEYQFLEQNLIAKNKTSEYQK